VNFTMIPVAPTLDAAQQARLDGVVQAARELISFSDADPALAARAGVEVLALEAKMALQGSRLGGGSIDAYERLDGIVALAGNRIGECVAAMDREMSGSPVERLSRIIGLAGGAIGVIRSIF